MSKAGTWRSSPGQRRAGTTCCRRWQPICSVVRWMLSLQVLCQRQAQPRRRLRRFRSSLLSAATPVEEGLVARLNQPEGNLTGATAILGEVTAKRLQMLHELVPAATIIGVLLNPSNPNVEFRLRELREAAHSLRQQIQVFNATSERDFDAVFATLVQQGAGALLVGDDPMLT